ncbi:hypothetical protein P8452_56042 [Trifolium repens]|jgi:hypothetical protein|nr:hypothetical protein P8452_56042 [Trifolium repens]
MLYDPDVSKEVANSMAKLEIAKYKGNKIKKATSTDVVIPKRKIQSIHRRYYTMFNGICREVFFMNRDEKDETDTTKLCDVVLV